ncbi:MAG: hypothetical protein Q9216_001224 [Gyalolechia sp. 2 TL-2023]
MEADSKHALIADISKGGALADPAARFPNIPGSRFFRKFPYALPNLVASLFFFVGLIVGSLFLKETLETKKHRRDYGRIAGKAIIRAFSKKKKQKHAFSDSEQSASLLKHGRRSSVSTLSDEENLQSPKKLVKQEPPSYREVFSKQTNINLLTYTLLALHSVAYDQLLPIFMHHPPQVDRSSNPNVHLPFKFSGGFGIDSDRIGLLFTFYGVSGTIIQFLIFPPIARRYGVLNCLKIVTVLFPLVYVATPFTALISKTLNRQIVMFLIMLIKCFAAIFAFPCTTILLTNSAASLRILGTLNGVATSVSAIGRATGPAIGGAMFEVGAVNGWAILPWWVLAGFAILGAIPVWWLVEMDGFGGSGDASCDDDEVETPGSLHSEDGERQRPRVSGAPKVIPREELEVDDSAKEDEGLLSTSRLLDQVAKGSGGTHQ